MKRQNQESAMMQTYHSCSIGSQTGGQYIERQRSKKANSADPTLYTSVTQRVKREGMREEEEKDTWAQGPMYASNWKLLMSVGTGRLGSKKVLLSNTMGSFACMFIP